MIAFIIKINYTISLRIYMYNISIQKEKYNVKEYNITIRSNNWFDK